MARLVEKRLVLTCPQCKQEKPYGGYPADPVLSTVLCLGCGYAGAGATFKHRHPKGETCSLRPVDKRWAFSLTQKGGQDRR